MMLDNDLLAAFRAKAEAEGIGYQTLINRTLRHVPMRYAIVRVRGNLGHAG